MKTKLIFAVLMSFAVVGVGCAGGKSNESTNDKPAVAALGEFNQNVELTIDHFKGDYRSSLTSTYSFYYLNKGSTPGLDFDWDIKAANRTATPGKDEFYTGLSGVSIGLIADLGEKSCKDIPSKYDDDKYPGLENNGYPKKKDRKTTPYLWFTYSDGREILQNTTSRTAQIAKGHCYIVFKSDSRTQVIAAFSVKDYEPGKSVVLSEIEVFFRSTLQYNR